MAVDINAKSEWIINLEAFLDRKRPEEKIRHELDLGYKIENQDVFITEIRPRWNKPSIIDSYPIAKTTYVKKHNHWKVFWMRSNLKWYAFDPEPIVNSLSDFLKLVEEDKHYCFFG